MRRILIALGLSVAPSIALAETYVLPVVTARIAGETYSTTTGFRNDSNADVECIGRYVREDGRVLTAKYVVSANTHRVEPDTLVEARAVGSMRLDCSGALAIASRIQASRDDGLTFTAGHVFAAGSVATAVTSQAARTIRADGDLLALEPDGNRAAFRILVKDGAGTIVAEQAYELRPHSQQHIGLRALVAKIKQARVQVKVRGGRVIVLEQSRTKALAALAPEVTLQQRVSAAKSRATVSSTQTSVAEALLVCPFKAAPFRDPATGLCFMRDRWYDPETGTFLTPDRSGYADSSNLYAFGRNDPVNLSDPTGEAVPAVVYLGHVGLQTGIDVGIDWAFHEAGDWWTGADTSFDWHGSLQTNFAVNLVSAGIGGKLKHFEKLRNPILRKLATEGGEYGFDVAVTGTADRLVYNQSASEAYGTAALGGVIGRSVGHGWNRARARPASLSATSATPPTGFLYRRLHPSEVSGAWSSGLKARDPRATITPEMHILGVRNTQFISTTRDLETAARGYGRKRTPIVEIDASKLLSEVIDFTDSRQLRILTDRKARYNAERDAEVLVEGFIPPGAIRKFIYPHR